VVHGFTGSPHSLRPLADALATAGHTVELPLLPGHGTRVEDMIHTGWSDWCLHVEAVHADLAQRVERVFVVGLSMGGALALWLASRNPALAGIVTINAVAVPDHDLRDGIQAFVDSGAELMDAVRGDIAKPDVPEVAYDQTPLRPLLTLQTALEELQTLLPAIRVPTLLIASLNDHVVPAATSDHIAARIGVEAERLSLTDSFHVATLDYDQERIITAVDDFIARHGLIAGHGIDAARGRATHD
jgi:carboxylesterase